MEQTAAEFLRSVLRETATTAAQTAAYPSWSDEYSRKEIRECWADQDAPLRKQRQRRVTVAELLAAPRMTLLDLGFGNWDGELMVIPLWAFNYIADGETLTAIDGDTVVKGTDPIDLDVRGGCIAFGFKYPEAHDFV